MIEEGEKRPFGFPGPKFPLPRAYFQGVNEHPEEALGILSRKLASENELVRINACDFLLHLAEVDNVNARVIQLLKQSTRDQNARVKLMAQGALELLRASDLDHSEGGNDVNEK